MNEVKKIIYVQRDGAKKEMRARQDRFLAWLYGHALTRMILCPLVQPSVSRFGGRLLNSPLSAVFARWTIKKRRIDLSQYTETEFVSYNAFFTRKLKPGFRTFVREKHRFPSPCDGKLSVYPIEAEGRFLIKHTVYTLETLLEDKKLAARYEGGWAVLIRLTVEDYHRYCYIDEGEKSAQRRIEGVLHTVNPVANDLYPIYKMNTREYCLLKTENFGTVLMMEVGALLVGQIVNDRERPCHVRRGEEKGHFEFGGSTLVLLIEKGRFMPDEDLIRNTRDGYETLVKMGEQIGKKRFHS